MSGGFETEVTHLDGEAILVVRGEIDAATSPQFADACRALAGSTDRLILDFAAVTFMDSSGLRVLLGQNEQDGVAGIEVRNPQDSVERIFQLTGLAERFLAAQPPPTVCD